MSNVILVCIALMVVGGLWTAVSFLANQFRRMTGLDHGRGRARRRRQVPISATHLG